MHAPVNRGGRGCIVMIHRGGKLRRATRAEQAADESDCCSLCAVLRDSLCLLDALPALSLSLLNVYRETTLR